MLLVWIVFCFRLGFDNVCLVAEKKVRLWEGNMILWIQIRFWIFWAQLNWLIIQVFVWVCCCVFLWKIARGNVIGFQIFFFLWRVFSLFLFLTGWEFVLIPFNWYQSLGLGLSGNNGRGSKKYVWNRKVWWHRVCVLEDADWRLSLWEEIASASFGEKPESMKAEEWALLDRQVLGVIRLTLS